MIMSSIPDIQSSADTRNLRIGRVGIKDIRHPAQIKVRGGGKQATAVNFCVYSSLAADRKGVHMSRFVALLNEQEWTLDTQVIGVMAEKIIQLLDSESSYIRADFPFFVLKQAPVSRQKGWMDYLASLSAHVENGKLTRTLSVTVPVKSLCPCSKKISDYGAHNQRSQITISAQLAGDDQLVIEDLVDLVEDMASCQLYSVLKRPDEKFVTERAYDNPKFVEDLVRDIAMGLKTNTKIVDFEVQAENFESIHNHSAYACIRRSEL